MTYPEKIPSNNPVNSFNFSFARTAKNQKKIENELNEITERILKILDSEKFHINGFPVLKNIYALGPDRSDFKKLAKACERLGDLVQIINDLQSKMTVIQMAQENPNWLTFAFGDFQEEIDKDIESLFNEK